MGSPRLHEVPIADHESDLHDREDDGDREGRSSANSTSGQAIGAIPLRRPEIVSASRSSKSRAIWPYVADRGSEYADTTRISGTRITRRR
jgi:hypothetical protein